MLQQSPWWPSQPRGLKSGYKVNQHCYSTMYGPSLLSRFLLRCPVWMSIGDNTKAILGAPPSGRLYSRSTVYVTVARLRNFIMLTWPSGKCRSATMLRDVVFILMILENNVEVSWSGVYHIKYWLYHLWLDSILDVVFFLLNPSTDDIQDICS